MRLRTPLAVLEPDLEDPRLADVGEHPTAWADGDTLTIAVRRPGEAPLLVGTVYERLRPAGDACWALRLRVPELDRACIEYGVLDPVWPSPREVQVWRGRDAAGGVSRADVDVEGPLPLGDSEIAAAHPVRFWSPPAPKAVVVCADGEGLAGWAGILAAAGERVALVGIHSAGVSIGPGEEHAYEISADPRARAYLRHVDEAYFAAHMEYVLETVLPWAEQRVGRLPRVAFGVSNGAAFAAALGALRPPQVAGVLAFSLGDTPRRPPPWRGPAHALVAGRLEPDFDRTTRRYALRLHTRAVPVRLRRPLRGHDHSMWEDELLPALRWVLA